MAFLAASAVSKIDPTNTRPMVGSTDRVGFELSCGDSRLMKGICSCFGAGRSGVHRLMSVTKVLVCSNLILSGATLLINPWFRPNFRCLGMVQSILMIHLGEGEESTEMTSFLMFLTTVGTFLMIGIDGEEESTKMTSFLTFM